MTALPPRLFWFLCLQRDGDRTQKQVHNCEPFRTVVKHGCKGAQCVHGMFKDSPWSMKVVKDAVARDIVPEHRQVRPYMAGCAALWRVQGIVTLNCHFKGVVKTI